MKSRLSSLAQHFRRLWSAYAVLLAAVLLSAIAHHYVGRAVDEGVRSRVQSVAEETQRALVWRVDHYLSVVYGVRGLIGASQEVTPEELNALLELMEVETRYPAMQGVAYAKVSPARVTITRVGPLASNRGLLGANLRADPGAREAMRTASRTGRPFAITRTGFGLEPDDLGIPSVWVFLPVYREPVPPRAQHPGASPIGFVVGIFRTEDLLQNLGPLSAVVDYEVYDGPAPNPEHLLYDDDGLPDLGRRTSGVQLVRSSMLPFLGHPWTFFFSTRPGFEEVGVERGAPLAITVGGSLVGVLLFGIIATQIRGRVAAERLTTELRSSERAARASKSMAEQAEHRAAILADASRMLASSLDDPTRLGPVAKRVVPFVADGCIIDLVMPDGSLAPVAIAHEEPGVPPWLVHLRRLYLPRRDGPALAPPPPVAQEFGSVLVVPLSERGRLLGAMSFFLGPGSRQFDGVARALAEDLARRVSAAVDNELLVEEAHEAVRLRDDFLVVAAHELKTPLTALQLQISSLGRLLDKERLASEQLGDKVGKVRRHLVRLTSLVDDLLDISRITSGLFDLHVETVDLGRLGSEVVDRFREQAAARGSALSVSMEGDLVGSWDAFRLDQVLTHLVSNALKYGLGRPVCVSMEAAGDTVRVRVRDEGIGIAPKDTGRIFNQFERAVSSDHYGGLGLGLFISRHIVEALGGHIRVESELGRGATFILELPRTGPSSFIAAGRQRGSTGLRVLPQSNSEPPV
ncbi:ATP-binding protein [Vitiosangium sp. GDMCC 1.1324]|uniref:CHASE domain-containing sensor histidine kinase n=1 Tax=Vitiosangium sp. (strain GDMCC 1.1324) TaxID=2138576 RepID=UPI000D339D91|nr:ATP-binding protein [Vitiosangium sp. GDMCC 1.1324]PTL76640.1 hypothetical protein DAT35_47730 [Vitiosangium sp. GDMCC 1.1324]